MPSKEAAAFIPLSWAAGVAYEEFVKPTSPDRASRSDLLDLLALSISLDTAIYVAGEGGQARRLTREELAAGRFAAGGLRFEFFDGRPALHDLRVSIGELPEPVRTVVSKRSIQNKA
jgi:hypothetical protein